MQGYNDGTGYSPSVIVVTACASALTTKQAVITGLLASSSIEGKMCYASKRSYGNLPHMILAT